jgi:hypothetical protein
VQTRSALPHLALCFGITAAVLVLGGCATEYHRSVQTEKPIAATQRYQGPRSTIAVGKFDNRSTYLRGLFSDGVDRLGGQAKTILIGHLQETGRFNVLERENLEEKANGLPTAGEMNQVPPGKVGEITGADAVMYVELKQYGSKYVVLNSVTTVEVLAKLVDARTGILLWQGRGFAQQSGSGSGNLLADLIAAAITQAINKKKDTAHNVSRLANDTLFLPESTGLPYGPYSPKYDRER